MRFSFEGALGEHAHGEKPAAGSYNFLHGSDPSRWVTGASAFEAVRLPSVTRGVDAVVTSSEGGLLLRLLVAPGADLADVVVRCDGVRALHVMPDGSVDIEVRTDTSLRAMPAAWETDPDSRRSIAIRAKALDANRLSFEGLSKPSAAPLMLDLDLTWSTHFGGSAREIPVGTSFDHEGNVIVVGATDSLDLPLTPGAFDAVAQGDLVFATECFEMFVSKFSADGHQLLYSTYLGGSKGECVKSSAVCDDGSLVITGSTTSPDYPATPGAVKLGVGIFHLFVTRLNATGTGLVYSALIGGNSIDEPYAMALDGNGHVIVCGNAQSSNFPVTPDAIDSTKGINADGFLLRLSEDGSSLLYSSYVGADGPDELRAVAVSPTGEVVVAGLVGGQITTPGAYDPLEDSIFVARFAPDLRSIEASTYFGGIAFERVLALALGPHEEILIAGYTESDDLPVTPGAFQSSSACPICSDGFLTCFDPMLTSLIYSTYLAGAMGTTATALHVDGARVATVAGSCDGPLLPTTAGAYDTSWNGFDDIFVTRLDPRGATAWYSTYVGGSGLDSQGEAWPVSIDVDEQGSLVLATTTNSPDFPASSGAYQPGKNGPTDAVIMRLEMLPAGASKYGASTQGCLGPLAIGVTSIPQIGNEDFALTCTQAPPLSAQGLAGVSLDGLTTPMSAVGTQLWIDPLRLVALMPATSNEVGLSVLPVRLPNSPAAAGLQAYVQFFWKDGCGPSGWSASNGLRVTLQP